MTGEFAVKGNTGQKEFRTPLCSGATRGQEWLHIGAVCNGIAWAEMEGK